MQSDMKQHDREYMKSAMLKQEEMFKIQVHELHRLYKIQKQLMRELQNAEMAKQRKIQQANIELWNAKNETATNPPNTFSPNLKRPRLVFDLELPAEEYIGQLKGEAMLDADEESDLELKLSTGSSGGARSESRKQNSCSKPFASDSGSSFSSSSNESGSTKENGNDWRKLFRVSDVSARLSSDRKAGFRFEEERRKDGLKQPPWLFPCSKRDMIVSFGL